ncbi:hypothetical protein HQ325_17000 [Rhodococcus sp. BP-349]|uniref:hypothetical protein n=1 Tax=unclassified Rhodococcus (in: high G+C Gram-positive bacteria) TaxID=192944 RepID=UPI001C9A5979|nr:MULTISPECIES: hypothetical protein [unclassified Rhodococcus (in: high G+C Gram-positive bacteria)]MBY6540375.1 hypothetical protein [Rhodococcus sp. BP-363]MBY6545600.1 hypothetical protein [Rhodococcus sp. BP-369]MBY6564830.1 hypothetical protein [Rhodococcus sp. BP-370]MBY6578234.1 hypothetical protein [Rhodococcus sp. BP-364]MBY6587535.1 hypothetical protein [Rhodococcus sp. BP-358]
MTQWIEVLVGMADGPTTPVQGTVKPYWRTTEPETFYYGSYGEEPVEIPLAADGVRLTRWGRRARIESLDGTVLFLSDGETAWNFTDDPQRPRSTALRRAQRFGPGRALVVTRPTADWVGDDHARPIGPVTDIDFLGRPCWSVELAARESIAMPEPSLILVVDAESGAVVAEHSGDGRVGAEYTDIVVGTPMDTSSFTWDGPVETDQESRQKMLQHDPHWRERGLRWFRDNVTTGPIKVSVHVELTPQFVEVTNEDTDEFTAPLGTPRRRTGLLIRRRHSPEPWAVKMADEQFAWSTADFDWTFTLRLGTLDYEGLAAVQQQLHPGEPVTGTPDLVPPTRTAW